MSKPVQFCKIEMTKEEHKNLRVQALLNGKSLQALMGEVLREWLKHNKKEK